MKKWGYLALMLVILLGMSFSCTCPEGSTWTADCYNEWGELVHTASGDGCVCKCKFPYGSRNCSVYSPSGR